MQYTLTSRYDRKTAVINSNLTSGVLILTTDQAKQTRKEARLISDDYWLTATDESGEVVDVIVADSSDDLVVLEAMPACHRASHRAAHNWGIYPLNGSERSIVSRSEAEQVVAADEDEYDHIVRTATAQDLRDFG